MKRAMSAAVAVVLMQSTVVCGVDIGFVPIDVTLEQCQAALREGRPIPFTTADGSTHWSIEYGGLMFQLVASAEASACRAYALGVRDNSSTPATPSVDAGQGPADQQEFVKRTAQILNMADKLTSETETRDTAAKLQQLTAELEKEPKFAIDAASNATGGYIYTDEALRKYGIPVHEWICQGTSDFDKKISVSREKELASPNSSYFTLDCEYRSGYGKNKYTLIFEKGGHLLDSIETIFWNERIMFDGKMLCVSTLNNASWSGYDCAALPDHVEILSDALVSVSK